MTRNFNRRGDAPVSRAKRDRMRTRLDQPGGGDTSGRMLRAKAADLGLGEHNPLSCIIAHELRQPLFTIAMASENLRLMLEEDEGDRTRMRQSVHRIAEQVQRAQAIIDQTLALASGAKATVDMADLGEAAANAVRFATAMLEASDVEIKVDWAIAPALVAVSRIELEQVFINLLRNAVDSIEERRGGGWQGHGKIVFTIERVGRNLRCIITDNGAGLKANMTDVVFEPFFTTKAREGTGLGLHICRDILTRAKGTIRLVPGLVEGARVEIRLEVLPQEPASAVVAT